MRLCIGMGEIRRSLIADPNEAAPENGVAGISSLGDFLDQRRWSTAKDDHVGYVIHS